MKNIIVILRGNYPAESWKLEGNNAKAFAVVMSKKLGKYTDTEVFDALDDAMEDSPKNLPSVVAIRAAVKRRKNTVPDYRALPAPEVNPKGINRIKNLICSVKKRWHDHYADDLETGQGWHWPPSTTQHEREEISRFARHYFPDIEDKQIAEDFEVFREEYRSRGVIDGHKTALRMDKYTGQVYRVLPHTLRKEGKDIIVVFK